MLLGVFYFSMSHFPHLPDMNNDLQFMQLMVRKELVLNCLFSWQRAVVSTKSQSLLQVQPATEVLIEVALLLEVVINIRKDSEILCSSCQPIPSVTHLSSWTPPGAVTAPPPCAACAIASLLFLRIIFFLVSNVSLFQFTLFLRIYPLSWMGAHHQCVQ